MLNDGLFRTHSSAEYIARSSKVVTLVDLAGHERYFKTTAYGLTGHLPDYACLIVGANAGGARRAPTPPGPAQAPTTWLRAAVPTHASGHVCAVSGTAGAFPGTTGVRG